MSNWPKPGDSLLAIGDDLEKIALAGTSGYPFLDYAVAYKRAADVCVESVEQQTERADRMIYPVAFLYRHYIELMLKGIIQIGRVLDRKPPDFPQHHRIAELWQECRAVLE
ncbi:MAG: hypothetical protein L0Z53_13265, partial [Acidobacteriales bacterium]|nr:hypothetical protein [Terriglobales bacterium]